MTVEKHALEAEEPSKDIPGVKPSKKTKAPPPISFAERMATGNFLMALVALAFPDLKDRLGLDGSPQAAYARSVMSSLIGDLNAISDTSDPREVAASIRNSLERGLEKHGVHMEPEAVQKLLDRVDEALEGEGLWDKTILLNRLMADAKELGIDADIPGNVPPPIGKVAPKGIAYSAPATVQAGDIDHLGLKTDAAGHVTLYAMNSHGALDVAGHLSPKSLSEHLGGEFRLQSFSKPAEGGAIEGYVAVGKNGKAVYLDGTTLSPEKWDGLGGFKQAMTTPEKPDLPSQAPAPAPAALPSAAAEPAFPMGPG